MDNQLFFLVEYNLMPIQKVIRALGHSAFLTYDSEIGLKADSKDIDIIRHVVNQKRDLGIDRIILTRDSAFAADIGHYSVKIIIMDDNTDRWKISLMQKRELVKTIIAEAMRLIQATTGQAIGYVQCSRFYKK